MHSTLTNPLSHGEHQGYRPGEFDHTTGIVNPEQRGYVRGSWNRRDHVRHLLADLQQFTSHSLRAVWETLPNGDRCYTVYSYATDIASWYVRAYNPQDPGRDLPVVQISMTYYGQITRTHQSLILTYLGRNIDPDIAPTEFGG